MKQVVFFTLFHLITLFLAEQLSDEVSKTTFPDKGKLANEKDNFVQQIEKQIHFVSAQPPMLVYVPVTSCHLFLSQDFGEFFPPIHTDNSLTNIWCNWTIWAGPGKHIVVYVKNFIANEDCDRNEDKIVFEGVLSTVENTVVYACWNKITHVFAARALAVHVVFLSSSPSHKLGGKYFHGSYYIFKDYGTDVALHCPLLSSIRLPTPVRENQYSNNIKPSTKIPLLSSISDAVKLKEIKHSGKTSIFMRTSSLSFLTSGPFTETLSSRNLETVTEQRMHPPLSTPIDYIKETTVSIQQPFKTNCISCTKTYISRFLLSSKTSPVSPSKMDYICDIKPNVQAFPSQFVPTSITGVSYVHQTDDHQFLLASTIASTLLEVGYVGDSKDYTLPVQLGEVNRVKDPKAFIKQYLHSVTVPTSVKEMAHINDTMPYTHEHLLSSMAVSTFENQLDYAHETTPCTRQSFYSSIPAFASRWAMDYVSDINPSTEQFLFYPAVAPVIIKELVYVNDTRTYSPETLLSSVATSTYMREMSAYETSAQQVLFSSISVSTVSMEVSFLTDFKTSTREIDCFGDIKPSLEQTFHVSIAASISIREMDSSSGTEAYALHRLLPSMATHLKEINYIRISKSTDQHFFSTIDMSASVEKIYDITESKAAMGQPCLASVVAPMVVKEMDLSKNKSSVQQPFLFTIAYLSGEANIIDPTSHTEHAAHYSRDFLTVAQEETSEITIRKIECTHACLTVTRMPGIYNEGERSVKVNLQSMLQASPEQPIKVTFLTTNGHSSSESDPIEEKYFRTKTDFSVLNGLTEKQNSFNTASYWETIYSDWRSETYVSTPFLNDPIKPADVSNAGTMSQPKESWSKMRHLMGLEANKLTSSDELKLNSGETSAEHATFSIVQVMSQNMMENLREQTVRSTHIKCFSSVISNGHSEVSHLNHSVYKDVTSPRLLSYIQLVTQTQTEFFVRLQFKSSAVGMSKEKSYLGTPHEKSKPVDLHLVSTVDRNYLKDLTLESSKSKDIDKMDLKVVTMAANDVLKDDSSTGVFISYHQNILNMDPQQILPSRTILPPLGSLLARAEVQQQMLQDEKNIYALNTSNKDYLNNLSTSSAELHFQDAKKLSQWVSEAVSTMVYRENISKHHTINESSEIFPYFRAWLNYQMMKAYERAREFAFHRFGNQNEDITPPLKEVNEIHINEKPSSQILPSSPFDKLKKTAGRSRLSTDLGILITQRERTSHYSFSDMVPQNMIPLETRDNQDGFAATHIPWGNGSALETIHSPGDVLFKVIIEIEHQGLIPNTSNEEDLTEFIKFKIKEKLSVLSRQHLEMKLLQTERMETHNTVLSFWIQFKPETRNMSQEVKSQLDTLANSTLGNETAILVSFSVEDVDECKLTMHLCDKQATCLNEFGTYSCHCKRGFDDHSSAAPGTLCVHIHQSDFGFHNYLEILIVVPLCAILLLVTVVAILCGIVQKRHAKGDLSFEKRHSPEKDPAEKSKHTAVPLPHTYTSEHLIYSSFPQAQLSTVEELLEESDNKRFSISLEQTAC
uniref:Uncharacterized protein LOC117358165 n=1 Tax=Geotrypetes seraphini TaxID=260995 RepID=A0A6P8QIE6_GEOSA|nr:uncharacterized protein LOC117358165 [Geotrypetes seraphini]